MTLLYFTFFFFFLTFVLLFYVRFIFHFLFQPRSCDGLQHGQRLWVFGGHDGVRSLGDLWTPSGPPPDPL
jgi:hypothetical protein